MSQLGVNACGTESTSGGGMQVVADTPPVWKTVQQYLMAGDQSMADIPWYLVPRRGLCAVSWRLLEIN